MLYESHNEQITQYNYYIITYLHYVRVTTISDYFLFIIFTDISVVSLYP